jgi:hypothetical protein
MLKITTTQMNDHSWSAWLTDDPLRERASGDSEAEAIGDLIIGLSLQLGAPVELTCIPDGKLPEEWR